MYDVFQYILNFFILIKDQFVLKYIAEFSLLKFLELTIFILGFVYINLMIRENPFAWLIAAFNCSVLTYIWYTKDVLGNIILYSFYVCNAGYAFIRWKKKDANNEALVKLKWAKWYISVIQLCLITVLITVLIKIVSFLQINYGIVSKHTGIGLFILVFSLYSLFLQVNKNIESWLYFTIIDTVVCILYIKTGLYLLALVKCYIAIMSGYGFVRWIYKYNRKIKNSDYDIKFTLSK